MQRLMGSKTSLDREEDVGSGSGDEEIAQARFAEIRRQNNEAYRAALGAASRSILEQCTLDLEGQAKEADRAKKAKAQRKRRKKTEGEKSRKMTRPIGVFCMEVDSEDDSDLSWSPVRKTPGRAATAKGKPSAGGAAAAASATTASGSGGPSAEGGGPEDPGGDGPGDGDAEGGGDEGTRAGRGRRAMSLQAKTTELWNEFNGPGTPINMWGSQQEVKIRQVTRWANTARTKATQVKTQTARDAVEVLGKRLNVIDSGLKVANCLGQFPPTCHLKPLQCGVGESGHPLGASRLRVRVERTRMKPAPRLHAGAAHRRLAELRHGRAGPRTMSRRSTSSRGSGLRWPTSRQPSPRSR